jgi:hypothetical protein
MGVSGVSQFIQSMNSAGASVKTIDAALKQNEQQLKATGDAETYLQQKQQLLNGKLKEQKKAIEEAQKALKKLDEDGTSKVSKSYQDMQRKLLNAQTAMMETQQQIEELGEASVEASSETDQLANSLSGLNKKVSLEQVTSAIHSITNGLERAASKAISLGESIWSAMMDKAKWADDTETMALMYGIDLETFLQMQKLVQNGLDTTVDAILNAQTKLKKNVGSGTAIDELRDLGLLITEIGKAGNYEIIPEDSVQLFWDAGKAIMALTDEYEKENKAQAIFGRSWKELVPLFERYESLEDYNAALKATNTNTEEEVSKLSELNDKVGELQGNFDTLETKVMAGLAPALTKGAEALSGLLENLLAYLDSPAGQQALADMEKAVTGLFEDLSTIEPDKVVEGFAGVFTSIVGGLQWLTENSGTVIQVLKDIVIGWGALEIFGGALDVLKLVQGIQGLTSGGAAAGAAAGASWGSAFASAVAAAAPWLIGLYTMLNPSDTANSDMYNSKTGQLTSAGYEEFIKQAEAGTNDAFNQVAELYEGAAWMLKDVRAMDAMAQWMYSGYDSTQRMIMMQTLDALGYGRRDEYALPEAATSGQAYTGDQTGEVIVKDRKTGEVLASSAMDLTQMESYEVDVSTLLEAEDGAEQIQEQVGTVTIPVQLDVGGGLVGSTFAGLMLGGSDGGHSFGDIGGRGFANGLWSVPFDGYHAVLHKGERVMTAREVASRNYSSNLYVESMYMNNGQDAEGLAAAMAAAQRRTMSGYGS